MRIIRIFKSRRGRKAYLTIFSNCRMQQLLLCLFLATICALHQPGANAFASPSSKRHAISSQSATRLLAAGDDTSNKERKPWEIFRFISQSSKFISPPKLPFLRVKDGERVRIEPGTCILDNQSAFCMFISISH